MNFSQNIDSTAPRADPDDILLALVGRLEKSPARVDEHFPDVLRVIADLRAEVAHRAAPRSEGPDELLDIIEELTSRDPDFGARDSDQRIRETIARLSRPSDEVKP